MKKILFLSFFVFAAFAGFSSSKYTIDDAQVETLMEQSVPVPFTLASENALSIDAVQGEKNPWVAAVLAFPSLLGWTGIHRVYLGTSPGILAGYIFTCGGIFGILPLIDCIVLIINNEDISAYVDKKGLIMFN